MSTVGAFTMIRQSIPNRDNPRIETEFVRVYTLDDIWWNFLL